MGKQCRKTQVQKPTSKIIIIFNGGLVVAIMTAVTNDVFRIVVTAKSGSIQIPDQKEQWMTGMTIIKLG